MAGELDFTNPNSFYTIIQILQAIGTRAGIKKYGEGSREWLFVECDGVPYLMRSIISEVIRLQCFYGKKCFEEHTCFMIKTASSKYEFDWLEPVCGLLHLEMNLGRAFLKLN